MKSDFYSLKKEFYRYLGKDEEKAKDILRKIEKDYFLSKDLLELKLAFYGNLYGSPIYFKKKRKVFIFFKSFIVVFLFLILIFLGIKAFYYFNELKTKHVIANKIELYLKEAHKLEKEGKLEKSLENLNMAYNLAENKEEILKEIARVSDKIGDKLFEERKYSDAISFYKKALSITENVKIGIKLAIAYYRLSIQTNNKVFLKKSLEILNKLEKIKKDPEIYLRRGYVYIRMGRLSKGLSEWKYLVNNYPGTKESNRAKLNLKNYGF